jgi:hypothetical protein
MRPTSLLLAVLLCAPIRAANVETDYGLEVARLAITPRVYEYTVDEMYKTLIATVNRLRKDRKETPKDAADKLKEALPEALPGEALMTWTAEIYSRHFTPAELRDLAAFYRTPLGGIARCRGSADIERVLDQGDCRVPTPNARRPGGRPGRESA